MMIGVEVRRSGRQLVAILAAAAVHLVAACGPSPTDHRVSEEAFKAEGKVWPLTVASGEVGCTPNQTDRSGDAIWFKASTGTRYGLNSFAKVELGFSDLTPIWREDERANAEIAAAFPGETLPMTNRLSIGDLAASAQQTCYEIRP